MEEEERDLTERQNVVEVAGGSSRRKVAGRSSSARRPATRPAPSLRRGNILPPAAAVAG
jgi:hypothetical protein